MTRLRRDDMKPTPRSIALSALLLLLLAYTTFGHSESETQQFLTLGEFTTDLEKAIVDAKLISPEEEPFFIIQKVKLKLRGQNRARGDGSVSFSIPVFKHGIDLKAQATNTQQTTLEVTLVPREKTIVGGPRSVDLTPLVRTLKETFRDRT